MRAGSCLPSILGAVKQLLLSCCLVLCAGCTENTASDSGPKTVENDRAQLASAEADGFDDSDCNLQTVLDPNKPGSPGNLIKSQRNPNGDSELAVLMRVFVDDLREARLQVQGGAALKPLFPVHRSMRCAWPTKPSDRDEGYDARSQAYLGVVSAFDAAPSQDSYNAIIKSCVACHQVSCGGVIEFIESLRWE